jgi:hypothetical protein
MSHVPGDQLQAWLLVVVGPSGQNGAEEGFQNAHFFTSAVALGHESGNFFKCLSGNTFRPKFARKPV